MRVETIASAVSAGTEMLVYRGEVPRDLRLDLPTFAGSYAFPIKYGYAAAGRVLDTGSGVEYLSPGDPVFVHHPHQEIFVVPAQMPVRLPDDLDPVLGVFSANLETALNIVHDTPMRLGENAAGLRPGRRRYPRGPAPEASRRRTCTRRRPSRESAANWRSPPALTARSSRESRMIVSWKSRAEGGQTSLSRPAGPGLLCRAR